MKRILVAVLVLAGCGGEPSEGDPGEATLLRARAEAYFVEDKKVEAAETLAPLVAGADAAVEDLVRAGIIQLALSHADEARTYADRADAAAPGDARVAFLLGNIMLRGLEFEAAADAFRRVLAVTPDDLAAHYQLGDALDYAGQADEAMAEYNVVKAAGVDADGPLYKAAINKMANMHIRARRVEQGLALREESAALEERGITSASPFDIEARGYGRLMPPLQMPVPIGAPVAGPWPDLDIGQPTDLEGAEQLLVADVDADGRADLVGWGKAGLVIARQTARGVFHVARVHERPVRHVAVGDIDVGSGVLDQTTQARLNDRTALELLVVEETKGAFAGSWSLLGLNEQSDTWQFIGPNGIQANDVSAGIFSDFDHDGQLDIVLATTHGLRLIRNNGALRTSIGPFPDATPALLTTLGRVEDVLAEDLDGDNDVDYVAVIGSGLHLLFNLRGGAFEDVTPAWNLPHPNLDELQEVSVADLDQDGRPDLLLAGTRGARWLRNEGGRFSDPVSIATDRADGSVLVDFDLDGQPDLLTLTDGGVVARHGPLANRDAQLVADVLPTSENRGTPRSIAVGDMNGDGLPDLITLREDGAYVLAAAPLAERAVLPLTLKGSKDNAYGVGAIVELRAGPIYRRVYWTGEPVAFGLGAQEQADVIAFTWPNGVIQRLLDVPAGTAIDVEQLNRVSGSCPFLYTWNGETFTFVTDVLGATPLGLPMAPGMMVPFDHEEYVKVRGDQLVPRDGKLVLALTEELREVTYLDRVRLHAIDHPADVEIEPNEGFVFPPFPPHHVHTFSDVVAPARITASNGEDLTLRLGTLDGVHAQPFVKLPPVYKGLAEPWSLELVLAETTEQRAALAAAPKVRLALTGWLQWGNASVNLAAARHPEFEFAPPTLSVPDGVGWRATGPPIGFPAGKTKTLVVDITDLIDHEDPRLLLSTTLQLSWDAIRIVLDDDDAPTRDTVLEAERATLSFRGFSAPTTDPEGELPELFDWDLVYHARWDQHPGRYTRYGEVLTLLGEVDDMYVIFGAGDSIELSFDATALPPLPDGWTRDWLVYLDGWAKDRDPNTVAAERVEPLPFHGMSAYPPPDGEVFPWDEAHRAWDALWNTRQGARLIEPLAHGAAELVAR